MDDAVIGLDGRSRCPWGASPPDYAEYHDSEWGRPVHGDRAIFERLVLEAFQSGLSWLTILRKREGFTRAFAQWDPERIAAFDDGDLARLMADPGIVRNRAKIRAASTNARALISLWAQTGEGSLDRIVWGHAPAPAPAPRSMAEIPSATAESRLLAKELKALGFVFVGPTTAYAAMQAMGLVNDHLQDCTFR